MKMPPVIPGHLFAPCGMNCMVCYVHLKVKKPCNGCLGDDLHKPERCKTCQIKNCAHQKGHAYCFECADFPCKSIKNLEKSYNQRYNVSLVENSIQVKMKGVAVFQVQELAKWTCKKCSGVISLHDQQCSECHQNDAAGR